MVMVVEVAAVIMIGIIVVIFCPGEYPENVKDSLGRTTFVLCLCILPTSIKQGDLATWRV